MIDITYFLNDKSLPFIIRNISYALMTKVVIKRGIHSLNTHRALLRLLACKNKNNTISIWNFLKLKHSSFWLSLWIYSDRNLMEVPMSAFNRFLLKSKLLKTICSNNAQMMLSSCLLKDIHLSAPES